MKVVVLHRALATPNDDWYPWLVEKFKEKGVDVRIPLMSPPVPTYDPWMDKAREALADADKDTYVVGHSIGNTVAFKVMEGFPERKTVGGMIAAAPVYSIGGELPTELKPMEKFFEKPVEWEKLKKTAKKFVVFHDRQDDHVPFSSGETISKKLAAKLMITEGKGHYLGRTFPELFDTLCSMMKLRD